ncbi:hypothetical protein B0I35DRAFT_2204 [Stachybotrys elegans]|uniref:polynucleotide adenylyltransferase n=1 Tax=Stachybotrys elegans TaxID=80388 RepID=A0A8K0T0J3_9HYPO|nr:hypothetical protein B0I35DRAFT_2204 [Stachybotrys elegans]
MAPDQGQPTGVQAHGLENRLRNMILTNNEPSLSSPERNRHQTSHPPTMNSNAASALAPLTGQGSGETLNEDPKKQPTKTVRKRPNQAQRRQMNSQLMVPIDPRPPPVEQRPRPNTGFGGYHGQVSHYQHRPYHGATASRERHEYGAANQRFQQSLPNGPNFHSNSPSFHHQSLHHDGSFEISHRRDTGFGGGFRRQQLTPTEIAAQGEFLDGLSYQTVVESEIQPSEIAEKEAFRQRIEHICQMVITKHEEEQSSVPGFPSQSVELKCFGSLSSGFATKASDMDLGLLSPISRVPPDAAASPIPRLIEKAFLEAGLGARLLTRTRVPIIKLCENPPDSLRQALLREREKWESGPDQEGEDPSETHELHDLEIHEAHEAQNDDEPDEKLANSTQPEADQSQSTPLNMFKVPCGAEGRLQYFSLNQGGKNLASYYALAKRVLRKAGCVDVTAMNYRSFTEQEWVVLNRMCQAFVDGLSDVDLKEHLAQTPYLSFDPVNAEHNRSRSLLGVYTSVEGENILRLWNMWPYKEVLPKPSTYDEDAIRDWEELQHRTDFGVDPIMHTKELQLALDKVKKIPLIQLLLFQQDSGEMPSHYHSRARTLFQRLQLHHIPSQSPVVQAFFRHYAQNIFHKPIRDSVVDSLEQSAEVWDFETLGRSHKSHDLARELEVALTRGYHEPNVADIHQYIALLRSPLRKPSLSGPGSALRVPLSESQAALVTRMRSLSDPYLLSKNKPRERYRDELEFPKEGAGVQCDINFSAQLALQNSLLLRCYSHTDPRVRPMVLFVKRWAKVRGINSGYRGTLSSYGYVLMVLHYLVNVAQPFVCPNLQQLAQPPPPNISQAEYENTVLCKGYNVQFWRNESQILQLAQQNLLNHNKETLGQLLRGFFEYYAQGGFMSNGHAKGFDWGREVLSLRTQGGLRSKQEKGWTGAKTVLEVQGPRANSQVQPGPTAGVVPESPSPEGPQLKAARDGEVKEVRHRYLFAIEDPFELEHNVARTVTHNGIVSIRDEFRRAWRIIQAAGRGEEHEDLLKDISAVADGSDTFGRLLEEIHGTV